MNNLILKQMKIWLEEVVIAEMVIFCVAEGKIIMAVQFLRMSAKNIFLINQEKMVEFH